MARNTDRVRPSARPVEEAGLSRVLVEISSSAHGLQLAEGISRYVFERAPAWDLIYESHRSDQSGVFLRYAPLVAGVLVHVPANSADAEAALGEVSVPMVLLEAEPGRYPTVSADNEAIGREAVEHFRNKGLRSMAYVGVYDFWPFRQRREGFEAAARAAGVTLLAAYDGSRTQWGPDLLRKDQALQDWLRGLPKPVGLLADNQSIARRVLRACRWEGVFVPEQVAVLGVDRNEALSRLARPSLSAVDHNMPGVGYRAAEMLDQLLRGDRPESDDVRVAPLGVDAHQSTDTLAVEDPAVVQAIRLIRRRAPEGLTVGDVVQATGRCRRTLEYAFRRHLGRSVFQEIRRVQIERAKGLLAQTDLPCPDVAVRCGFNYATRLGEAFKKATGLTPTQWRRQVRNA